MPGTSAAAPFCFQDSFPMVWTGTTRGLLPGCSRMMFLGQMLAYIIGAKGHRSAWMAPEVLHHEPSDEKSGFYCYGVIMFPLVTRKIPWDNVNKMQVIGAVSFLDQRPDIPSDTDP